MIKILSGVLAAILIAVAGYFGFQFYVQSRAASEVDAAFASIRATGAKASHGKVSFDTWTRTVTITEVAVESVAQPPASVKIARVTAAGVKQSQPGRFAAERIVASDVDVAATMALQGTLKFAYRAPQVEIIDYAGPAGPLRTPNPSIPGDLYRVILEQFATVSAGSITAPTVTGSMAAPDTPAIGGEYTYAGVAMRDIRDGKIATTTVDRASFTTAINNAGKTEKMTGEVADLAAYDFDAAATLAMFDPARANDEKVYRGYRQMKTGAYSASFESGPKFRIDGMVANEIGIKPSRLQFPKLLEIVDAVPPPGTTPTAAQLQDLLDKAAAIYEGLSLGDAEIRGLAMETPEGPFRLAAIKLGKLENGKLAEFAFEGLEARAPQGPVEIGRLALKSLDVANLLRMSGQLSAKGDPSPDELVALLGLLEGTELRNLVAPYKDGTKPVNIDTFTLNWGQFVGPIPTRMRTALRMYGPVETSDPDPFRMLAASGVTMAPINLDLGAAWNEAARTFTFEPMTVELGGIFSAAARLSLSNVPREAFTLNPLVAAVMTAQIEVGPVEIALRDIGGVELILTDYANKEGLPRGAARAAVVANIQAMAAQMGAVNPDILAIAGALQSLVENPRGTVTIKLTPKGKIAVAELLDSAKDDPLATLARFQVDVAVSR